MKRIVTSAGVIALLSASTATAQTTQSAPAEPKHHEFACTAATVGGAVAGVALGGLLGGGLGKTLFETAGGVSAGMLGHHLKCPGK